MNRKDEIAKRIKALRMSRGISQAELARLINCAQSTIAMYETGKRAPDFDTIDYLADVFNVSAYDILFSEAEIKTLLENTNTSTLSIEETQLITAYRAATESAKEIAFETLKNHPAHKKANRA